MGRRVSTTNNTKLDSGIRTISFSHDVFDKESGQVKEKVFSLFRINPADVKTGERAMESADYFENLKSELETIEDVGQLQKDIEDKISYILGYESSDEIFGEVSALTILPDGSMFVEHVVGKIMEVVEPAIEQRQKAMAKRAESYTAKYKKK